MKLSKYTTLIEEIEKGFMLIDEFDIIVDKSDMDIVKGYLKDKGFREEKSSGDIKFLIVGRKGVVKSNFALYTNGSSKIKVIEEDWNLRKMLRGESIE